MSASRGIEINEGFLNKEKEGEKLRHCEDIFPRPLREKLALTPTLSHGRGSNSVRTDVSSRIAGEGLLKNVTSLPSYLPIFLPSKRSAFTKPSRATKIAKQSERRVCVNGNVEFSLQTRAVAFSEFPDGRSPVSEQIEALEPTVRCRNSVSGKEIQENARRSFARCAFTLAEVLITLVIVGVVAVLTLTPLVNDIRHKGYVEQLKKMHTTLQIATSAIIAEEGTPNTWNWTQVSKSHDNSGNEQIVDAYKRHLDVRCSADPLAPWLVNKYCDDIFIPSYKHLDGTVGTTYKKYPNSKSTAAENLYKRVLFGDSHNIVLNNGSVIGITFRNWYNALFYGTPTIYFTVDINGVKGPNIVGRDVFFFYMKDTEHGTIVPFTNKVWDGRDMTNTCNKHAKGFSCAYRVLIEDNGKMKY